MFTVIAASSCSHVLLLPLNLHQLIAETRHPKWPLQTMPALLVFLADADAAATGRNLMRQDQGTSSEGTLLNYWCRHDARVCKQKKKQGGDHVLGWTDACAVSVCTRGRAQGSRGKRRRNGTSCTPAAPLLPWCRPGRAGQSSWQRDGVEWAPGALAVSSCAKTLLAWSSLLTQGYFCPIVIDPMLRTCIHTTVFNVISMVKLVCSLYTTHASLMVSCVLLSSRLHVV